MAIVLLNHKTMPPAQYPYQQGGEKPHYFPGDCDIINQALKVESYRKANKLPRASFHEALEDIDLYTCQRLGGDPRYCRDTGKKNYDKIAPVARGRGCSTCGTPAH